MKFEPIEQRSDEWLKKRLGRPTASQFDRIITPGGRLKLSDKAPLYMAELIGERIFQRPMHRDVSHYPAVQHGVTTEPQAAAALMERIGPFEPGGLFTDDEGRYGCSPDGILIKGNRKELIEIKCPYEIPNHIRNLLFGLDDKYRAQVQGQLFISKFDCVHFWSYHPDCPPAYYRVDKDEPFMRVLDTLLDEFCEQLEENYQKALAIGGWKLA